MLYCHGQLAQILYDYQTLFSGILAILAAVVTAYVIWKSAEIPLQEQRRTDTARKIDRAKYGRQLLSLDLKRVAARARQAQGTVRAIHAANAEVSQESKAAMTLSTPTVLHDWEFASLLPLEILEDTFALTEIVEFHNFDIARAGTFTADNFRDSVLARAAAIEKLALEVVNKISQTKMT